MKFKDEFSYNALSADEFEELCAAILSREGRGLIVERYGRSGQSQFGIDILGIQASTGKVVAVECKRREKISIKLLKSITHKFWQHRERWLRDGVHRFILCFAAEIRDRRINDFWLQEAKRFRRIGIVLEIWSARTLANKISRLPDVRRKFFSSYSYVTDWDAAPTEKQIELYRASANKSRTGLQVLSKLRFSQFSSLLKAFNDELNTDDREILEARLVDEAGTADFSSNNVNSGIKLLRRLINIPELYQNWKFRRTLGRIAGEFVNIKRPDSRQRFQVRELAEHCFEHPDTSILLAVTATSGLYAARAIGAIMLKRLILQKHPQVRWLIMRGWPVVEPVITDSFSLPQLLETEDTWLRRRFLLTLIHELRSGNHLKLKSLLVEHLHHDSSVAGDTRFEIALRRWLRLKAGIDLYARRLRDISKGNIDLAVLINTLKLRRDVDDIHRFSAALDYHCINLDYSSSPESLHIGGAYSEGRYGIIRQWVEEGLSSVHEDLLFAFIDDLLNCADEGVRWAISASMSNWLPKIIKISQRRKLILKLLNDWHPWVVRESLEQMGRRLSNFHGLDSLEMLTTCSASIGRAVEQGWDEKEFLRGYLTALAYYPDLVDQITIRQVA
jgi:Restriction endonuclease